mgnify:FL=1
MKTKLPVLAFFFFCALSISGCLRSLHPLYSDKTLEFNQKLVGTWADPDSNIWTFVQSGPKAYDLVHTEKRSPGRFEARLVKLGQFMFLDIFPKEPVMENGFYKFHLIPVHTISRIWIEQEKVRMAMLNLDWFKEQVEKKKIKFSHERRDNEILLTASTADLQKFVVKYANDPKAFAEPGELRRMK